MPTIKLKVSGWLSEEFGVAGVHPEELLVSIAEGATILEMVRQLPLQHKFFRKVPFGKPDLEFGADILVTVNGVFVNPHDQAEARLRDGDEVTLLPMVSGG
jgi:molybdopterin converting factor small subunit